MENVLILGARGMLGGELEKVFSACRCWDRDDFDALDFEDLKSKILSLTLRPEAIINCVAFNDVDGAEEKKDLAFALNAEFVGKLAGLTAQLNIPLVHFSTNYVFDGEKGEYEEASVPEPVSVYGRSKYEGEKLLAANTSLYYLVRTAVLFGTKGRSEASKKSFVELMVGLSQKSDTIKAVSEEVNSVTYAKDLAGAVKFLLSDRKPFGIYHLTNSGQASWYDLAGEIFRILGKSTNLVPVPASEFPRKAKRPRKAVLVNTKFLSLRPWQEALGEYLTTK